MKGSVAVCISSGRASAGILGLLLLFVLTIGCGSSNPKEELVDVIEDTVDVCIVVVHCKTKIGENPDSRKCDDLHKTTRAVHTKAVCNQADKEAWNVALNCIGERANDHCQDWDVCYDVLKTQMSKKCYEDAVDEL